MIYLSSFSISFYFPDIFKYSARTDFNVAPLIYTMRLPIVRVHAGKQGVFDGTLEEERMQLGRIVVA